VSPKKLRKELGQMLVRVDQLERGAYEAGMWDMANSLRNLSVFVKEASDSAGKLLVAQLTDADRAQAEDAAGRA